MTFAKTSAPITCKGISYIFSSKEHSYTLRHSFTKDIRVECLNALFELAASAFCRTYLVKENGKHELSLTKFVSHTSKTLVWYIFLIGQNTTCTLPLFIFCFLSDSCRPLSLQKLKQRGLLISHNILKHFKKCSHKKCIYLL